MYVGSGGLGVAGTPCPVPEPPAATVPDLADLFGSGATAAEPARAAEPPAEEEIAIGGVVLPRALYTIYIGEAEQHAAALQAQMSLLEADPMHPVGPEFMRAAHTLSSSSRTISLSISG